MQWVRSFSQISKNDTALAGGKGASLGEMTGAGISVPPGYVILSNAFDKFLEVSDVGIEIDAILKTVNIDAMHTIESASEQIQRLILEEKEIPKEIEEEILSEFKQLGTEFVAVRSSATAEDSAAAAWAGQLDTFLNTTEETLLQNVRKCWASLFTPRAIFYRFEKELNNEHISVGVVVQKMVNSEAAGIAFSVHPVTEDHNQMIIEAGFGLGEAVVSGEITPDSYVVTKDPRKILDKNIITQKKGLFRKAGGGNEWRETKNGAEQVLSGDEILKLSETVVTIENHYGSPQDIEWAKEGDDIYITQSRPITTLSNKEKENSTIATLKNKNWDVDWDADLPHLAISITCNAYFERPKKLFGTSLNHFFVTFREGKAVAYLEADDLGQFSTSLVERVNTVEKAEKWAKSFRNIADEITVELSRTNPADFLKRLDHFNNLFDEYGAWQIATKAVYSVLPSDIEKNIPVILEDARKYSEKFYKELSIFFSIGTHLAKENEGYSGEDLVSLTLGELQTYLKGGSFPPVDVLRERWECSGMYLDNKPNTTVLSCSEVEDIELGWTVHYDGNEIKGTVAYRGRVQGKCRLIKDFKGASIKEGEILVTVMTDPNYVPLMKKAAAIVTDGGGMLSHAAIVSREMKKPCIIGTKISTQVLKDGDEVEVDADKGIVRVLGKEPSIVDGLNREEWAVLKTPAAPLIFEYNSPSWVINSVETYGEYAPLKKYVGLLEKNGDITTLGIHKADYFNSAKYLWEHREKLAEVFQDFDKGEKDFLEFIEKLQDGSLSIVENFKEFLDVYYSMYSPGIMFDGFLVFSEAVVQEVKGAIGDKHQEEIDLLLQMPNLSFSQEEHLSLLNVANADESKRKALLNEHREKFHWILNNYKKVEKLPLSFFEENLKALLESADLDKHIQELVSYSKDHKDKIESLRNQGEMSNDYIDDLCLLGKIAYYVDCRKASNLIGNHWIGEYIKTQSRNIGIKYEDALMLLSDEFEKLVMDKGAHIPDVSNRHERFGVVFEDGTKRVCEGVACDEVKDFLTAQVGSDEIKEIKGAPAFKGLVKGKVKIFSYATEKTLEPGEILVTSMTRPDFVPLMKKAAAIITDEGGITSHAAIVSRELKVPCVIGTKIATQILKDGDEVEVSANEGVVRILSRENEES